MVIIQNDTHVLTTSGKQLKSHVRHEDPEIMSIAHIHVLLLSPAISLIVSLTLPSWSPVLVPKLPNQSILPRHVQTRAVLKLPLCSSCSHACFVATDTGMELGFLVFPS